MRRSPAERVCTVLVHNMPRKTIATESTLQNAPTVVVLLGCKKEQGASFFTPLICARHCKRWKLIKSNMPDIPQGGNGNALPGQHVRLERH